MRFKAHDGNNLTEYMIIAVLVFIATAATWTQIASGFTSKMTTTDNDFKSRISSAQKQAAADAAAAAAAANAMSKSPGPGSGSATVGPTSISGVSSIIQTAGANGATDSLASSMEATAKQLLASGKINQDQANLIQQLAQAGHGMADAENALQSAVKNGSSSVTYNGKTTSVDDFKSQFGFDNGIGINAASTMTSSAAMAQLQPFMNLYDKVQASGALNDPTTSSVVTNLSQQIASLSDLTKWNTTKDSTDLSYAYVTAMQQVGVKDAPKSISDATHTDSAGICGAGAGSDSGTSCNP